MKTLLPILLIAFTSAAKAQELPPPEPVTLPIQYLNQAGACQQAGVATLAFGSAVFLLGALAKEPSDPIMAAGVSMVACVSLPFFFRAGSKLRKYARSQGAPMSPDI